MNQPPKLKRYSLDYDSEGIDLLGMRQEPDGTWIKLSDLEKLLAEFDENSVHEYWSVTSGLGQNPRPFIQGALYVLGKIRESL